MGGRLKREGIYIYIHTYIHTYTLRADLHCCMEKEMATDSSVLAWRIPGTAGPGGLPSMGSHRVRHD